MDIERLRDFCLSLKGTTEETPFGEDPLVYKVMGKMFATLSLDFPPAMNLKCDPDLALKLREEYHFVASGYHMNKKHWNTISELENIPDALLKAWILHSYELVVSKLTKKLKEELKQL